jgi:hypothetical protein
MAETRRWLRSDGNSSYSLAQDNADHLAAIPFVRLVRFSFLILIARFVTLDP